MSTLQRLESEVRQQSETELAAFREWFAAYDAENWDRQWEGDVRAGRLDRYGEEALAELRLGKTTDL